MRPTQYITIVLLVTLTGIGDVYAAPTAAQVRSAMAAYRQLVPERCEVCCKPAKFFRVLEVHHALPRAAFPEVAADTGNMLLVCRPCHQWVCHPGDFGKYTARLREWLSAREIRENRP